MKGVLLPLVTGVAACTIAYVVYGAQGAEGHIAFLIGWLQGEFWANKEGKK